MSIVAALAPASATVAFAAESLPATPGLAAEASPASTKFVSKRYGYEIVLAPHYAATYARKAWTGGPPLVDSGEVDVFTDSRDHATPQSGAARFFVVAATRARAGTTLRGWERSHAAVMTQLCRFWKSRAFRNTTLGGVPAREFQIRCPVHDAIVVVALHRGLGYTFQYVSPGSNSAASDRRNFDAGRRGFRFTTK